MHRIAYRMRFKPSYRTLYPHSFYAYAVIAHPLRSGGNDVDRNDRAYDKDDYLGKNYEKELRNMSD